MDNELKIGAWRAFPALNQLRSGALTCKIKPRSMDVLVCMAARPGEVLSVEELLTEVWKGVVVGDNSVYQAIHELRSALETAGGEEYIETIPRRGYRLAAEVGRPPPRPLPISRRRVRLRQQNPH